MILNKKFIPLFLSLSLVLPNIGPIYSYAEVKATFKKEQKKIETENNQKQRVSNQLEDKFDLEKVSGSYVAKHINKYNSKENFEYAVKEVLNYYYDKDQSKKINQFKAVIDSRADDLIKDYEDASEEKQNDEELGYKPGEVIVEFENDVNKELKEAVVDNLDGEIEQLMGKNIGVVDISNSETVDKAIENYEDSSFIKSVQPNFSYKTTSSSSTYKATTSTNDEYSKAQYYLKSLKIYEAWDYLKDYKTSKVKVAVLDTGMDVNHPDLKSNLYLAVDAENNYSQLTKDKNYHGTHVSGILAATTNNAIGISGIGNNNIELMNINVFWGNKNSAEAFTSDILNGYNYAVKKGAQVINMSLGRLVDDNFYEDADKEQDKLLEQAINNAKAKGIVTVCSAGNNNSTMKFYPADFDSCISVINIDQNDQKAADSNYGTKKDISAYGVDIYSTIPYTNGQRYMYDSGTSMSAPIVSGIVAIMKSKNPNATVDEIKSALYSTADDIGRPGKDSYTGYGKVNALKAVKAIGGGTLINKQNTSTDNKNNTSVPNKNNTTNNKNNTTVDKNNNIANKNNTTVNKNNATTNKNNTVAKKNMATLTINTLNSSSTYISGKALSSATIKVYNSKGKVIASGKASNNKYSIKIPKQPGGSTIKVVASKTNYNSKSATTTVLKQFGSLTCNNIYKTSTSISGTGTKNATIKVYVNKKQVGKQTTVNSKGKYKVFIPKQKKNTVITIQMSKSGYVTKSINRTVK